MRLSYFESETDKKPRPLEVTWEQLAAQLTSQQTSPCTIETCGKGEHALVADGKHKGCRHKYIGAWSPAVYPPGATRAKANVAAVSVIVLDIDHVTDDQLRELDAKLRPYRYVAHATHGDRPGDRCVRIVLEPSQPIAGADWGRFWPTLIAELGVPVDRQTSDASRMFFLPSRPSDADFLSDLNEGAPLDVSAIMAKAPPRAPSEPLVLPPPAPNVSAEARDAAIAELASAWPPKGRHTASLALAGALASHGWLEDTIAAFIGEVTRRTGAEPELDKRRAQAADSIAKLQRGEHVSGWGTLAEHLAHPDAIGVVRERLAMRDTTTDLIDGLFPKTSARTISGAYPTNLAAIDTFAANQRSPKPTPAPGTWEHELERALADVKSALGTGDAVVVRTPLFGVSARELLAQKFPAVPWLVAELITDGGIAAIATEPKSAKTWLGTEIAIGVATGTPVCGEFKTHASKACAYFYAEDFGAQVQSRIRALLAGRGLTTAPDTLHLQPRGRFLDITRDEDLALLVASGRRLGKLDLLVLDPLRDIHSGEEDKSDAMGPVMKRMRLLGELLGCVVLYVHHTGKEGKGTGNRRPGQRMRGSGAIHGSTDCGIYLENLDGNGETVFTNTVRSEVKGARSAGRFKLTLTIEDDPATDTATKATWSVVRSTPAPKASNDDAESITTIVETIAAANLQKRAASTKELRTKLGVGSKRLDELIAKVRDELKYVEPHMRGEKHCGWKLTEHGLRFHHEGKS